VRGAVLVCGTSSGAGKSLVVTGLCRLLARDGVRVAPFKAQNMSNQSAVTRDGGEIGRAQWAQATAAGVEPEVVMNPVLLKPDGDATSQVVVAGRVAGRTTAHGWGEQAPSLLPVALDALADLRRRFDVVVAEGAGAAAETNLLDRDIVNLPLAAAAGLPAVLVADIERGGMFASVAGTFAVLPDELRSCLRGVIVNRFRGDRALLADGIVDLEARTGVPVLGVLPRLAGVSVDAISIDAEDALDLALAGAATGPLDVAVVRLPHIANATDVEPLQIEPSVSVRFVSHPAALGRPHLVVLPGTKATVADLAWLRATGLDRAIADSGATVLGICGGYQMLGRHIDDDVESAAGRVEGLGYLPHSTMFATEKVVRRRRAGARGHTVDGYEIHHGVVDGPTGWLAHSNDGRWWGTSGHGLFEHDGFRHDFLALVAERAGVPYDPGTQSWAGVRREQHDRIADALLAHLDLERLRAIIAEGAPVTA